MYPFSQAPLITYHTNISLFCNSLKHFFEVIPEAKLVAINKHNSLIARKWQFGAFYAYCSFNFHLFQNTENAHFGDICTYIKSHLKP